MTSAPVVLCFLLRGAGDDVEVLLGYKKTGFGRGKVVGIGGHLETGESAAAAICREMAEETSVTVRIPDLVPAGTVDFRFPARPEWDMDCVVFLARQWQGEPAESGEIRPEWHPVGALPLGRMWADAGHWLPPMLDGKVLDAVVVLNDDNETVRRIILLPRPAPN
ncbi:MAG: 8-oxo-dGTP diphosphatase [Actinomycetales bacterium]